MRPVKRKAFVVGDSVCIPLTQGKVAYVDAADADLGKLNWCARKMSGKWYAYRYKDIALHRAVAERAGLAIDDLDVDHRNGDGLNCRRFNLRPATKTQNRQNTSIRSNNRSGVKGVCLDAGGKWRVEITANGARNYLGLFASKMAAARAYAEAAKRLHGDFARLQ